METMATAETKPTTSSSSSSSSNLPPVVGRIERGEAMPVCLLMVGMAGSGKTTLMTQLQRSLSNTTTAAKQSTLDESKGDSEDLESTSSMPPPQSPFYCINLDPATMSVPFEVSIDIRDTVNYKEVMKQHQLGPNGAIMTSLNLYATKFDQVMRILEERSYGSASNDESNEVQGEMEQSPTLKADTSPAETASATIGSSSDSAPATLPAARTSPQSPSASPIQYILVDTPGQIEAFTWSASGTIICESLASAFPTVLVFVVDTVRCAASPNTFMSNMLYACSMMYRTRLPLVVCFNKTDVVSAEFCMEWMRDYDSFQQALDDAAETSGFYGSLTRSLSLVLDEFYAGFANACGVSAVTSDGISEFWTTVQKAATHDFAMDYLEDLKCRVEEQDARRRALARAGVSRLQRDLAAGES
jgi:GTPase SAR1 family protein